MEATTAKVEGESERSLDHIPGWLKSRKGVFLVILVTVLAGLIPLYGILFPPPTDLTQQVLVNKLLWEHLSGTSHLDLEVSWFLGYRLPTVIIVGTIAFFKTLGISLVYLPSIAAVILIFLHAVVIVIALLYFGLKEGVSARSYTLAACFSLPAVAGIYSACWFNGFIGYTLALTLLVPAIFLTEEFLIKGRRTDAVLIVLLLALIYAAHPFAIFFWMVWCFGRTIAAVITGSFGEWKKLVALGLMLLPVALYHLIATASNGLAGGSSMIGTESMFVTGSDWYKERLWGFLGNSYLQADEVADSSLFGYFALALIAISSLIAIFSRRDPDIRKTAIASLVLIGISSLINEKFIPVPGGHWLAYNYRLHSTVYVVCLAVAGLILIRSIPAFSRRSWMQLPLILLAVGCVGVSLLHLFEVREAYARFDVPAREYMAKVFKRERTAGIHLPRSQWNGDDKFLKRYRCLKEADCNPTGTLFRNIGGDVYPVKIRSPKRRAPDIPIADDPETKLANAFNGGDGFAAGQFSRPRGLTVDHEGNIYVADTGNSRVQKFAPDGKFLLAFGSFGEGAGEFKSPTGIALDRSGKIYVVDSAVNKLSRFRADGVFEKEWSGREFGFSEPIDIAANGDRFFIVDLGRSRITSFDPATEAFAFWGSSGNSDGQFNRPTGIGAGPTRIVVADSANDRIQIFDPEGKYQQQWEVSAWDRYIWHYPDAIIDEEDQLVYVSSGWSKEVLVFRDDGRSIKKLVSERQFELMNPSALALLRTTSGKRLYVLNTGSDTVESGDPSVSVFELEHQ